MNDGFKINEVKRKKGKRKKIKYKQTKVRKTRKCQNECRMNAEKHQLSYQQTKNLYIAQKNALNMPTT